MSDEKGKPSESDFLSRDFKSLEIRLALTNTTTQVPFREDQPAPSLIEFQDSAIWVEAVSRGGARGHHVLVQLEVWRGDRRLFTFEATGRIDAVEATQGQRAMERVLVTLLQYEESEWEKFRALFAKRQEQVLDFLKAARGW